MAIFTKNLGRKAHDDVTTESDTDEGPVYHDLPALDLSRSRPDAVERALTRPTECPSCGNNGYLDHIDIVAKVSFQHCPWCWTKWEVHDGEVTVTRTA